MKDWDKPAKGEGRWLRIEASVLAALFAFVILPNLWDWLAYFASKWSAWTP